MFLWRWKISSKLIWCDRNWVKVKVVPVLNLLSTTSWRRMGEWMYISTFFFYLGTSWRWVVSFTPLNLICSVQHFCPKSQAFLHCLYIAFPFVLTMRSHSDITHQYPDLWLPSISAMSVVNILRTVLNMTLYAIENSDVSRMDLLFQIIPEILMDLQFVFNSMDYMTSVRTYIMFLSAWFVLQVLRHC
jgi:hypothetical protein